MKKPWIKKRSKKIGLAPGSMVHVGEKKLERVIITLIDYDQQNFQKHELEKIEEVLPYKDTTSVTWINFYGLHETDILERVGDYFNIHPLVLEDILNTDQRPKVEIFDNYLFFVLKMISFDDKNNELNIEQLSLVMGENFVLTFQERVGDYFNSLRDRIKNNKGRIRKSGVDFLTYSLIDIVVDNYFLVLEQIGEIIEDLEENVLTFPQPSIVNKIQSLKRELIFLRKSVWPLRELITQLLREEFPQIEPSTVPFLRDLYDHTIHVVDTVETYRDVISGVMDLYLSSISNKMNEIMKVLTIIATIFIPLTFLAGIYGMNFDFMPELHLQWAYPLLWGIMFLIFTGMLFFFRRKKWL
jgi:magnesium transporter